MSDSSLRRRRIVNSLAVIRLVLQVLIRNPTLLGARWWLQLALKAQCLRSCPQGQTGVA